MRRSVKAVSSNAKLFVQLIRDGVGESVGRHGLVIGRIEYSDLRHVRQQFPGDFDTEQVGRIVQWGELNMLLHGLLHLVIDDYGFGKSFSPMHHAMAHGADFGDILEAALGLIGKSIDDEPQTLTVVRHFLVDGVFAIADGVGELALFFTDFFEQPPSLSFFGGHFKKLEFNR